MPDSGARLPGLRSVPPLTKLCVDESLQPQCPPLENGHDGNHGLSGELKESVSVRHLGQPLAHSKPSTGVTMTPRPVQRKLTGLTVHDGRETSLSRNTESRAQILHPRVPALVAHTLHSTQGPKQLAASQNLKVR